MKFTKMTRFVKWHQPCIHSQSLQYNVLKSSLARNCFCHYVPGTPKGFSCFSNDFSCLSSQLKNHTFAPKYWIAACIKLPPFSNGHTKSKAFKLVNWFALICFAAAFRNIFLCLIYYFVWVYNIHRYRDICGYFRITLLTSCTNFPTQNVSFWSRCTSSSAIT